ncbi:class I SAM-dependent methyltransferase [Shimia abyssi]|uniref:Methyltransferase family protein n=1 Tax=Shimia abyssi TaxID=1662395 RepID=A0A2P8F7B6_9RHOB|nr:class I SAM-dependent methyltransferase [Shimia abyssi]PSL17615.1 methyltransferase family protein [Shimia abyssi]
MDGIWEDFISRNAHTEPDLSTLPPAKEHLEADGHSSRWEKVTRDLYAALEVDTYPIPPTAAREGYYGPRHFSYWASGLRDMQMLLDCAERNNVYVHRYLDFGCASGRVIRHFAVQEPQIETFGSDLNRHHVEWVNTHLPSTVTAFMNHSIPSLPLPDSYLDLVSAYSVFTHIEAFETSWLMELRRVMKPGAIAWITIHSHLSWLDLEESWPLYRGLKNHKDFPPLEEREPMTEDRKVFRWRNDKSYSSNVFYSLDYIHKTWGRIFEVSEFRRRHPGFQDVIILKNTKGI